MREGGVDRDHALVPRDVERVVREVAGPHLHDGVVVDPLIEVAASHEERRDRLAGEQRLLPPGDHALLHEVHHAVGEHLGMHAEVAVVGQRSQHRVGDLPDAELECGSVGDQARDVPRDLRRHLIRRLGGQLGQVVVNGDERVDPVEVNERVAVGARRLGVHLGQDEIGGFHGGAHDVDRHAETHVPVPVRERHLDHRDVDTDPPALDERRDLRQEHGHEVGTSLGHGGPHVMPDKKGGVAETVLHPRLDVRGGPQRHEVHDVVVGEMLAVLHQPLDQFVRLRRSRPNQDPPPSRDPLDRLLDRRDLGRVYLLPVLHDAAHRCSWPGRSLDNRA
jgi:hypothetical protein